MLLFGNILVKNFDRIEYVVLVSGFDVDPFKSTLICKLDPQEWLGFWIPKASLTPPCTDKLINGSSNIIIEGGTQVFFILTK